MSAPVAGGAVTGIAAGAGTGAPARQPGPIVTTAPGPTLHLPDEPEARRDGWYRKVLDGDGLDEVVTGPDGIAAWLWRRWRILEGAGLDRAAFDAILAGYRRELWLWLAGERSWAQCCAGLVGRVERRMPA